MAPAPRNCWPSDLDWNTEDPTAPAPEGVLHRVEDGAKLLTADDSWDTLHVCSVADNHLAPSSRCDSGSGELGRHTSSAPLCATCRRIYLSPDRMPGKRVHVSIKEQRQQA